MLISGWGKNISTNVECIEEFQSFDRPDFPNLDGFIPRGNGRSYGDSSLSNKITLYRPLESICKISKDTLIVSSNLLIKDILEYIVPLGYFLPVIPGTGFVSIGGAVASNIHGKNAHFKGNISNFIQEIEIFTGNQVLKLSKQLNEDLFAATVGGMGLTGIILTIKISLIKINGPYIKQTVAKESNMEMFINSLLINKGKYSVGWANITDGRFKEGLVISGDHDSTKVTKSVSKSGIKLKIPKFFPGIFINNLSIRIFNKFYFIMIKANESTVHYRNFFFPLDSILNWNNLYGKKGLVQFQAIFSHNLATKAFNDILQYIQKHKLIPTLCVIKNHKDIENNFISFSGEGLSFAIDFKNSNSMFDHVQKLYSIVLRYNGKIYLTKDSFLSKESFRIMYPNWKAFNAVRSAYGCKKFKSLQSVRLGLDE